PSLGPLGLLAIRPTGPGLARPGLPPSGGRTTGLAAERGGPSDLPRGRLRPPPRPTLPPRRGPVPAPGTHVPAGPPGDAGPGHPRRRGRPRKNDRGGPGPQGVRDPRPRPARPDPDPRLAHGTMAGGDGSE